MSVLGVFCLVFLSRFSAINQHKVEHNCRVQKKRRRKIKFSVVFTLIPLKKTQLSSFSCRRNLTTAHISPSAATIPQGSGGIKKGQWLIRGEGDGGEYGTKFWENLSETSKENLKLTRSERIKEAAKRPVLTLEAATCGWWPKTISEWKMVVAASCWMDAIHQQRHGSW